jgi:hypothetical protein
MPVLRPQLGAVMPSLQVPIVDKNGKATLEFHRLIERLVAMNSQDEPFIALAQNEQTQIRMDELRAEIGDAKRAAGDALDVAARNADQLEDVRQELATALIEAEMMRPRGALAELETVGTRQIDPFSTYGSAYSETTSNRATVATTSATLAEEVVALETGSTAIIDVGFSRHDLSAASSMTVNLTAYAAPNRDVLIRLVRDPSGSPVVLSSYYVASNWAFGTDASAAAANIFEGWGFRYQDTGHGGGSVTYRVDIVSYNTGTTTLNGIDIGWANLRRSFRLFEAIV